jgi:hypothetical protein
MNFLSKFGLSPKSFPKIVHLGPLTHLARLRVNVLFKVIELKEDGAVGVLMAGDTHLTFFQEPMGELCMVIYFIRISNFRHVKFLNNFSKS